jgi:hypothetical protein
MSNQLPHHNLMFYGNVLFDHNIDVRYNVGVHNMGFYEGVLSTLTDSLCIM